MHILIGLCLAVVLLYFWLIGHWFARVLVFLLLASVTFIIVCIVGQEPGKPATGPILGVLAATLAWPIAGLPTYYWNHRLREYLGIKDYSDTPLTDSARRHGYR